VDIDNGVRPVVAVVLAAGGGSRFDGETHKLLATLHSRTIVDHAIRSAVAADIGSVVVITGAVGELSGIDGVRQVRNHDWERGQSTSLQLAIDVANEIGAEAMVVGLGDQPFIEPEAWRLVARSSAPIAIATYQGRRRNPVRLHRDVWPLLPHTGDEGARVVIRLRPDLVEEIPCPGSPVDIDTLEDLQTWQSKSSTNSP
jgi:CTP:molybdopterin cytidylyltransferase MocA